MEPIEIVFDLHSSVWLSANQRVHHMAKARRVKALRQTARIRGLNLIRKEGATQINKANITAVIHYAPHVTRADPHNAAPTVKALIDGLVDAGLFPDDNHKHIPAITFTRGDEPARKRYHAVTLQITPIGE